MMEERKKNWKNEIKPKKYYKRKENPIVLSIQHTTTETMQFTVINGQLWNQSNKINHQNNGEKRAIIHIMI